MMEVLAAFLTPIGWMIVVLLVFHPILKAVSQIISFIREATIE